MLKKNHQILTLKNPAPLTDGHELIDLEGMYAPLSLEQQHRENKQLNR